MIHFRWTMAGIIVLLALMSCSDILVEPEYGEGNNNPVAAMTEGRGERHPDSLAPLYEMHNPDRIPGRYIVRFNPSVANPRARAEGMAREHNGRVYQTFQSLNGFWGELPDEAIEHLRRNPNVRYIEADVILRRASLGTIQSPAPPSLDRIDQRYLPLDGRYEYATSGTGVHVWIIDTGVDRSASELAGRIDESWFVTNNGKDPYADCQGHGTAMAIAVAGAYSGVAKGATIHSARVDEDCIDGISSGAGSFAFEFIGDHSPRPAVANWSISRECWWIFCGFTVDDAAEYARQQGVTVVVSAGNGGSDNIGDDACGFSPAHVNALITVGATNLNDQRHTYSNYGSCVDLFAPVVGGAGTSTAAALVSGAAALYLEMHPSASPSTVTSSILSKATQNVLSGIGPGSPNRLLYTDPPVLSVTIAGPSSVASSGNQTWTANAINGEGPYSYAWYRKVDHWWPRGSATCHYDTAWQLVSTGPSYSSYVSTFDFDFRLRVDVTSAHEQATGSLLVWVGDGSVPCPI